MFWKKVTEAVITKKVAGFFSSDWRERNTKEERLKRLQNLLPKFVAPVAAFGDERGLPVQEIGMDNSVSLKQFTTYNLTTIPENVLAWYASQGFIGWQIMALLSQHWLVDKACSMPGKDAIRNGYEITVNDGTKVDPKILDQIRILDVKKYNIKRQMIEYIRKGRIFGIRVALFIVESDDPDYYSNPFNIDGIKPGSYKGVSQIDPYWMVPQLTSTNVSDATNQRFYEPSFWLVGSTLIHYSHLCIFTTGELPDILKPGYSYGGVSVPQRIFERIYAAERTANEAPMLAMTKRLTVLNTDLELAITNQRTFDTNMQTWADIRDNYGVKVAGLEEKVTQQDTALGDMDSLIMTQYQLVAAIAWVPGTKLLGTQPKGFNSTGEYEEASYHEFLKTIQDDDLTPFLERHHQLVIASDIVPKYGIAPFDTTISWNSLDEMTALEQAQLNLLKAQTDSTLVAIGAIDGFDSRERVTADIESGYNGLQVQAPKLPSEVTGNAPNPVQAAGGASDPVAAPGDLAGKLAPPPRATAPHIAPTPGA
jgi:phage-related protein (TIGR01555 family)